MDSLAPVTNFIVAKSPFGPTFARPPRPAGAAPVLSRCLLFRLRTFLLATGHCRAGRFSLRRSGRHGIRPPHLFLPYTAPAQGLEAENQNQWTNAPLKNDQRNVATALGDVVFLLDRPLSDQRTDLRLRWSSKPRSPFRSSNRSAMRISPRIQATAAFESCPSATVGRPMNLY